MTFGGQAVRSRAAGAEHLRGIWTATSSFAFLLALCVLGVSGTAAAQDGSASSEPAPTSVEAPPNNAPTSVEASVGFGSNLDEAIALFAALHLEHRWLRYFSTYVSPSLWFPDGYTTYHVGAGARLLWPARTVSGFVGLGLSAGTYRVYGDFGSYGWDFAWFFEASIGVTIPISTLFFVSFAGTYRALLNPGGYDPPCPSPFFPACETYLKKDLGVNLVSFDLGVGVRF